MWKLQYKWCSYCLIWYMGLRDHTAIKAWLKAERNYSSNTPEWSVTAPSWLNRHRADIQLSLWVKVLGMSLVQLNIGDLLVLLNEVAVNRFKNCLSWRESNIECHIRKGTDFWQYAIVVVCTDLSKGPHRQVGVGTVVKPGSLRGVMVAHWPEMSEMLVRVPL